MIFSTIYGQNENQTNCLPIQTISDLWPLNIDVMYSTTHISINKEYEKFDWDNNTTLSRTIRDNKCFLCLTPIKVHQLGHFCMKGFLGCANQYEQSS